MTSRDFAYWLQGYFELAAASPDGARVNLSAAQVDTIKSHLAMVFLHEIDPSFGGPEQQKKLDEAHAPKADFVPPPKQTFPVLGGDHPTLEGVKFRC